MIGAPPGDPSATALRGEVMAVRWRADDGDFAVLAVVTDEGEELTLTGPLAHVRDGETVEVEGAFRRHERHGWRFEVARVRLAEPVGEQALLSWLSSVKHVSIRGAQWLLERHGAEVLEAVDADPHARLSEVPGIGRARIGAAVRSWQEQRALRAVRLFLDEHGVPAAVAGRIVRAFGAGTVELLREDPYALTQLDGVGFATADALARALGVAPDAAARLDAGLVHALRSAEADGHCHLPRDELAGLGARLLGVAGEALAARIDGLAAAGTLVVDGERVADARLHAVERRLARRVRELLAAPPVLEIEVDAQPPAGPLAPTPAQWACVHRAIESRLSILTGLPGTGKTQTMRALVDLLRGERRRVRLCAPTGKAARRLAETTGADASTIHRLLEYVPGEGFARDQDDPLTGVDLLVVDEASMLDVRLAAALLDAVGDRTHVLLVGDVDQLAPVGPGRVLDDLIASGAVPATRLTEVFRQAARSLIIRAAHAINRGEPPPARAGEGDVRDFFVIERDGAETIAAEVMTLATERLARHYELDPVADVQVLVPMHRGPVGIDALNTALRARLNPDGAAVPGTPFRLGDRLVQTRNNHERELYNGEVGVLVHHDDERDRVILACDDGRRVGLGLTELDTLRLAYAMSIHKAQGSQAPAVVVVLSSQHRVMLTRNLLYTAVTRAQRCCVVVGERSAMRAALGRLDARRRHTSLRELVAGG